MPSWQPKRDGERKLRTTRADEVVNGYLRQANLDVAKQFGGVDVIFFRSPLGIGVDDVVRNYIEDVKDATSKSPKEKLCVLVETDGGYIEVVERIYSVFRQHYKEVDFVVPSFAYSAGTVLVLSGDDIYLDYYSVLGPIDPQIESDGQFVPGMGYLQKFKELVDQINSDTTGSKSRAQLAYLIKRFDPARLFHIEQAREHSVTLLKKWLPQHKFKNWTVTNSGKSVDHVYKEQRASEIASVLGNPGHWHSHGRGIGISELEGEDIKLIINNFGKDVNLNKSIREYYGLLIDFLGKLGMENALHGAVGVRRTV